MRRPDTYRIEWEWMAKKLEYASIKEMLEDLYVMQKKPILEVGDILGISNFSVRNKMRELGILLRDRHCKRKGILPRLEEDGVDIIAIYKKCGSHGKAAAKIGVAINTLKRFLQEKKRGVQE